MWHFPLKVWFQTWDEVLCCRLANNPVQAKILLLPSPPLQLRCTTQDLGHCLVGLGGAVRKFDCWTESNEDVHVSWWGCCLIHSLRTLFPFNVWISLVWSASMCSLSWLVWMEIVSSLALAWSAKSFSSCDDILSYSRKWLLQCRQLRQRELLWRGFPSSYSNEFVRVERMYLVS